MADVEVDEATRKAEERERKKAEVRKRLEEQGKAGKKAKKGFLTPERKKKLRKLLMMKAAEDLKQQQLKKEQERQKALAERTIPLPDLDTIDDASKLFHIYDEMWKRVCALEEQKYEMGALVKAADQEINELTIEVNDLRGKFVRPSLKKVSKYDNKFKKMAQQSAASADKQDFRANLKVVRKTENAIDEIMNKKKKDDKPDWSNKKNEDEAKPEKDEAVVEEVPPVEDVVVEDADVVEAGDEEEEEEDEDEGEDEE